MYQSLFIWGAGNVIFSYFLTSVTMGKQKFCLSSSEMKAFLYREGRREGCELMSLTSPGVEVPFF